MNMHKIIILVLCASVILSSFSFSVNAESNDFINDLSINVDEGVVNVSGSYSDESDQSGKYISIMVLKDGHQNYPDSGIMNEDNYSDVGTTGLLKHIGAFKIGDNNSINYSFNLQGLSGDYNFILTDYKGNVQKVTQTIEIELCKLYNQAKQSGGDAIMQFVSTFLDSSFFDFVSYDYLSNEGKEKIKNDLLNLSISDNDSVEVLKNALVNINVFETLLAEKTAGDDDAIILQTAILNCIKNGYPRFLKPSCTIFANKLTSSEQRELISSYAGQTVESDFYEASFYNACGMKWLKVYEYYAQLQEAIEQDYELLGITETTMEEYDDVVDKVSLMTSLLATVKADTTTTVKTVADRFEDLVDDNQPASGGSSGGNSGSSGGSSSGSSGSSFGGGSSAGSSSGVSGGVSNIVIGDVKDLLEDDESKTESSNVNSEVFVDLSSVEWAREAITKLYQEKIINGINENEFAPERLITRAEFAKILASGLRLTGAEAAVAFEDVKEDAWYYSAIAAVYRAGIANGMSETSFGPDLPITREDMAVMISRAAKFNKTELLDIKKIVFDDEADVSSYAKSAVMSLANAGIINGSDNKFMPKDNATRAEAAKMLYEFFALAGIAK